MASESGDVESAATKKIMIRTSLPKPLTLEEKKYLLAVERGDMPNVRRMLQKAHRHHQIDINCVDSLGRGALTVAIDGEDLEMVELLIIMGVKTRDALLHAINAEFVEAVELLLEHEELIHKEGQQYSWQTVDLSTATFTPDITPLVLAAHRNNYEICKILLDRGASIPMPHDAKCGCDDCIRDSTEDSLRHSLSRLNEYRALASPSLIALSSSDPILTAFQLSWELRNLAFSEPECKSEYLELRRQCQQFAVDLLHQSRSSQELAVILNHDPDSLPYEEGDHMKLARLELAITYKQKKFVAHPNIQQLLASIWYEGVPGFRRKSAVQKLSIIVQTAILFPFYCTLYMLTPHTNQGKLMRKPFMKFLIHASSYLFFLLILILVSQRAEDQLIQFFGTESMKAERFIKQRGKPPAILEFVVLIYVLGFIYEETYEIYVEGIQSYLRNMWNFIDFTRNFLYILVFVLRVAAYIQQRNEILADSSTAYIPREQWNAFDPQLIAEGLFAGANIFSALKLVHLFSINPHLGPLQISLGRMVIDIVKFFFIYSLVLFAFACGLNQLLWYFSDLERKKCYALPNGDPDWENQGDSCLKWRSFANVFEASQSLFWASFGMVDLANFELTGIKSYTRFWGLLMFGSYSVINVIVLLNLLIAMMSNSYAMIDEHSDTEWKFARTKLWMSYFEEGNTLPPPFNIFPTIKTFLKLFRLRKKDRIKRMSTKRRNKEEKDRDNQYIAIMRALVWRYITAVHKKCEEDMVTEDDINELKNDVSAFRFDMLEILNRNGMDISCVEKGDKAVLGKKMKIWERRLMKDFKVGPVVMEEDGEQPLFQPPVPNENPLDRFRRVARMVAVNSNLNKWGQVIKGACLASQIGHCSTNDSFVKQQNLLKAMEEAKRFITRSPLPASRSASPIDLPDTTGQSLIEILNEIKFPDNVSTMSTTERKVIDETKSPSICLSPPTPARNKNENIQSSSNTETLSIKRNLIQTTSEVGDFIVLNSSPATPEILRKTIDINSESSEEGADNEINDTCSVKIKLIDTSEETLSEKVEPRLENLENKLNSELNQSEKSQDSCSEKSIKKDESKSDNIVDNKSTTGTVSSEQSSSGSEKSKKSCNEEKVEKIVKFQSSEIKITNEIETKLEECPEGLKTPEKVTKINSPIPERKKAAEIIKTPEKVSKDSSSTLEVELPPITPERTYQINESTTEIKQSIGTHEKISEEMPSILEVKQSPEILKTPEKVSKDTMEVQQLPEPLKTPEKISASSSSIPDVNVSAGTSKSPEKTIKSELSTLEVKKEASPAKSPMASRNITRIGDCSAKRYQPKTGWL